MPLHVLEQTRLRPLPDPAKPALHEQVADVATLVLSLGQAEQVLARAGLK